MNTRHYLRLLRTFALAVLTTAAVAACSDDNDDGNDGNHRKPLTPADGIPVAFSADINPGSDNAPQGEDNPSTRTLLKPTKDGGFSVMWKGKDLYRATEDPIHIWAADAAGNPASKDLKTYIPLTTAVSSALEPQYSSDKLTLPSEGQWTFTAVYNGPYKLTANLNILTQTALGNIEHIAFRDFSVATATQMVTADSDMPQQIGLEFKHKLSALQLNITNSTGINLKVKEIRLSLDGEQITTARTYDIKSAGWDATKDETADYQRLNVFTPEELATGGGTAQDFYMLLFPGYVGKTMVITVITDRGEYTRKKAAPAEGFAAGTNYKSYITLKSSGLTTDEKWTEYIANADQLKAFRDKVNDDRTYSGNALLTADIDLNNEEWEPISDFAGTFEGGGYHISNLKVNASANDAGLFGSVGGGKVYNLRVSGEVTSTKSYVGGIAGTLTWGAVVKNCIFSGNVSGKSMVGGIAGHSNGANQITGCYTNGTVTTTGGQAGGIAGRMESGSVTDCYSSVTVSSGGINTGGITGYHNSSNDITVTRCYATGEISATASVGGICGSSGGTVENCLALNPTLTRTGGSDSYAFGQITGAGHATNCGAYNGMKFEDSTSPSAYRHTGEEGTALTAAKCLSADTYTTYGFTTDAGWAFDTGHTMWQYLPWNPAFETFSDIAVTDYCIAVPAHLSSNGTN